MMKTQAPQYTEAGFPRCFWECPGGTDGVALCCSRPQAGCFPDRKAQAWRKYRSEGVGP